MPYISSPIPLRLVSQNNTCGSVVRCLRIRVRGELAALQQSFCSAPRSEHRSTIDHGHLTDNQSREPTRVIRMEEFCQLLCRYFLDGHQHNPTLSAWMVGYRHQASFIEHEPA